MATKALTADKPTHTNGTAALVERLKEKSRLRTTVVHIDRWDLDVTIRELSSKEMITLREKARAEANGGEIDIAKIGMYAMAISCVDPPFTAEDIDALQADDMADEPIRQLGNAIIALNKMADAGVKSAESSFPDTEKS